MNPGRVNASDRTAPPGSLAPSRTSTERPALASTIAAARPFGPAPTTMASWARRFTPGLFRPGDSCLGPARHDVGLLGCRALAQPLVGERGRQAEGEGDGPVQQRLTIR